MTVKVGSEGRLFVSWMPNPHNEDYKVIGYKLTWDHPLRVSQSASDSVNASTTKYLITSSVDLSLENAVLVWAYSMAGDGLPARTSWIPHGKLYSY